MAGLASEFCKGEKSCIHARIVQPSGCRVYFCKLCENSLTASHEISNMRETSLIKLKTEHVGKDIFSMTVPSYLMHMNYK